MTQALGGPATKAANVSLRADHSHPVTARRTVMATLASPPLTVIATLLLAGAYLAPELAQVLKSAYFDLDDFNNIYWTQDLTLSGMLAHLVDARLDFFRPAGMFWYWLMGMSSQLDPVPFHILELVFNGVNVALVCLLVLSITGRGVAAILTAVLWISSPALMDALWWFGSMFEVVFTAGYLAAALSFIHTTAWFRKTIAVAIFYVLALQAKEMAITLPVVLLLYEVIVQRRLRTEVRQRVIFYGTLGVISAYFTVIKMHAMADHDPSAPYFFSLSLQTLGDDAQWYAAHLFAALSDQPAIALLVLAGLALAALLGRDRAMVFSLAFAAVSIAPVIFLPNHLFAFFLYLPSIGIWLCVAQATVRIGDLLRDRVRQWLPRAGPLAPLCLALAVFLVVQVPSSGERASTVEWTRGYADVFRNFVGLIRSQPEPPRGATMEVQDPPAPFDAESITLLYRVLYGRQDIRVRIVHRVVVQ
jgi:hypothetical protein